MQLSSSISKFQAPFQKFEHYLITFRRFFQRNRDMPNACVAGGGGGRGLHRREAGGDGVPW